MIRLVKMYYKFAWLLDIGTKYFCVGLTLTMFVNVMAQVFCNYVLRSGLSWSEEFSRLLLVWMTFSGAALVSRRALHIGLTAVINLAPYRLRHILKLAGFIIVMFFLYGLTIWGWKLSVFGKAQTSTYLTISYFWFYLGIPLGSFLIFIQTLYLALREIMAFYYQEDLDKEFQEETLAVPVDY
ncbi:MAG: TRAP transporter small permease [Deltaproteobacteria bacterium]|nr:TRAP transporter small permease [Deltaproteobacteria bacterium]